jgi:hypothetical protein
MALAGWAREDIIWFAGLFEGEGCLYLSQETKKTARVQVRVSMTDEDVVRKIFTILRVGGVSGPNGPYKEGCKPQWSWACSRFEDSQAVLAAIYPFLGVRRKAKIIECLTQVRSLQPSRQYGTTLACGRGHLRNMFSYRNAKDQWVCRECRRINERRRNRV